MWKTKPYEILAAVLAMFGAVLLVFTYYPFINPIQYGLDNGNESAPLSRYILGTPVSFLMLSGGWLCNRKARKMKGDEKLPRRE
jgi:hypothetical protein